MLTNCSICNKQIDLQFPLKLAYIYPHICSFKCFIKLLEISGFDSIDTIIQNANTNGLGTQILKDVKKEFKSKIEQKVAEFFDSHNIKYVYEKYIFMGNKIKNYKYQPISNRYYIPDFYLTDYNIFIEVKDKEILNNKAVELSKYIPIIVIDRDILNIISKGE